MLIRRSLTALGLATVAVLGATPAVLAVDIAVGSGIIAVPDLAPVAVPVPMGSEAAPLPVLPFPFFWDTPFLPAPGVVAPLPAPGVAPAPAPGVAPAPAPVRRISCREAWDLGVAPIHRGSDFYDPARDGDSDGIACEVDPR